MDLVVVVHIIDRLNFKKGKFFPKIGQALSCLERKTGPRELNFDERSTRKNSGANRTSAARAGPPYPSFLLVERQSSRFVAARQVRITGWDCLHCFLIPFSGKTCMENAESGPKLSSDRLFRSVSLTRDIMVAEDGSRESPLPISVKHHSDNALILVRSPVTRSPG